MRSDGNPCSTASSPAASESSPTSWRAIRPPTIAGKNSLFTSRDDGIRRWATNATTTNMNQVDRTPWLTQTLERIANGWPNSNTDALGIGANRRGTKGFGILRLS